jgi:streptomycin 6-kinase
LDAGLAAVLERWALAADGEAMTTATSLVTPVRRRTERLIMKIAQATLSALWRIGDGLDATSSWRMAEAAARLV